MAPSSKFGHRTLFDETGRIDLLRVYEVLFNRFGRPEEPERQKVIARLDPHFPARGRFVNAELCQVLVYLEADGARGLGFTHTLGPGAAAVRALIDAELGPRVVGEDPRDAERLLELACNCRMADGWTTDDAKLWWEQHLPEFTGPLTLTGSTLRPRPVEFKTMVADEIRETVWPYVEGGKLRPVIDSVFPLTRAAEAHARMEAGEHVGKIVLEVGE